MENLIYLLKIYWLTVKNWYYETIKGGVPVFNETNNEYIIGHIMKIHTKDMLPLGRTVVTPIGLGRLIGLIPKLGPKAGKSYWLNIYLIKIIISENE